MKKILVTGALGQIGSELVLELRKRFGGDNVIASDIRPTPTKAIEETGPFQSADVTNPEAIREIIKKYNIDSVFHLAAILSAVGEKNPKLCWNVNMTGSINMLEIGVEQKLNRIIIPSSMAVWGGNVDQENTPQDSVLQPTTMYGVTKVAGELLCDYYVQKFGLDCRGLRYPGIISSETLPGGGTTDYAVEIFYEAVKTGKYTCFLKEDAMLPMMYMPDCLKATIDLSMADFSRLRHHSGFNVAAMSFTPAQLAEAIREFIPDFQIEYKPDFRQKIAESWTHSIDDSCARNEWDWAPKFGLREMVKDMIEKLSEKHKNNLI